MTPLFDFTINIGGVLALVAIVITLLKMHYDNIHRMSRVEAKLDILFTWWQNMIERQKD